MSNTREFACTECGRIFIQNKNIKSRLCPLCIELKRKAEKELLEKERQKENNKKWEEACKKFEKELLKRKVISLENITLNEKTLYIIGNGFDLMHGVKSSYYAFRDYLAKKDPELKITLENYLKAKDIWANIEESLGKIDINMIAGSTRIRNSLELSGFLEDIDSDSKYYMAQDFSIEPMREITEVEKYFRNWIKNLKVGTHDRPLKSIIYNGKVLSFNYTEFIEDLYEVSKTNICYIHGCRKNKKEKLILGHKPNIDYGEVEKVKKVRSSQDKIIDLLQESVEDAFTAYDEEITKDTSYIIKSHQDFFKNLTDIENIVVIGHSVSKVDLDYFIEIVKNVKNVKWYFGCYGYQDLKNIDILSDKIKINPIIFRTDQINVTLVQESNMAEQKQVYSKPNFKTISSSDGSWSVKWNKKNLIIAKKDYKLERIMPENIDKCIFSPNGKILFIKYSGFGAEISFFKLIDTTWIYIDEMSTPLHRSIFNRRLKKVYINNNSISFIYNNRIREYSLETGDVIKNEGRQKAINYHYSGIEVTELFFKKP